VVALMNAISSILSLLLLLFLFIFIFALLGMQVAYSVIPLHSKIQSHEIFDLWFFSYAMLHRTGS
jgi:hypothetical protein